MTTSFKLILSYSLLNDVFVFDLPQQTYLSDARTRKSLILQFVKTEYFFDGHQLFSLVVFGLVDETIGSLA